MLRGLPNAFSVFFSCLVFFICTRAQRRKQHTKALRSVRTRANSPHMQINRVSNRRAMANGVFLFVIKSLGCRTLARSHTIGAACSSVRVCVNERAGVSSINQDCLGNYVNGARPDDSNNVAYTKTHNYISPITANRLVRSHAHICISQLRVPGAIAQVLATLTPLARSRAHRTHAQKHTRFYMLTQKCWIGGQNVCNRTRRASDGIVNIIIAPPLPSRK